MSATSVILAPLLNGLPFATNITTECRTAITEGTILTNIFANCGTLGLSTLGNDPQKAILQDNLLNTMCSSECTTSIDALSDIVPQCSGDSQIFVDGGDDPLFGTLLGGQDAASLATTFKSISDVSCVKNSDDAYCHVGTLNAVSASSGAISDYPPFAIVPPTQVADRQDVVCNNVCFDEQVKLVENDPVLSEEFSEELTKINSVECSSYATGSGSSQSSSVSSKSTTWTSLAMVLLLVSISLLQSIMF